MDEVRRTLNRFMAALEIDIKRAREKEAVGWVVVTVDVSDDPPTILHCAGMYETAEEALVAAGEREREDARLEEEGWSYVVSPMFKP